jgi:signal transduction histidine kinase
MTQQADMGLDGDECNYRILVVDDDEFVLNMYLAIFESKVEVSLSGKETSSTLGNKSVSFPDFQVSTASDGRSGYKKAKQAFDQGQPFSVAFVDMRMPHGWDGLDTARALREFDDDIFVVIVTGYSDHSIDDIQDALEHDVLLVNKPFNTDALYQLARTLCDSWTTQFERKRLYDSLQKSHEDLRLSKAAGEAAAVAKSTFLNQVSESLRTPMSSILGMVGLLLGTSVTSQQQQYMEALKQSANTLGDLLDDVLDMANSGQADQHFLQQAFDWHTLIESLVAVWQSAAEKKGLSISVKIDNALAPGYQGDSEKITKILNHLLDNAIKFTLKGSVCLHVSILENQQVCCTVEDTGIGIENQNLDKVFENFVQLDTRSTRVHGGTGMGLSLSRALASALNGEIGLQSEIGEGTRVCLCVPLGDVEYLSLSTLDRLKVVVGGDFHDVVQRYLEDVPELLSTIRHSIVYQDWKMSLIDADRLYSSSKVVGAGLLEYQSRMLKSCLLIKSTTLSQILLERLEGEFFRIKELLVSYAV